MTTHNQRAGHRAFLLAGLILLFISGALCGQGAGASAPTVVGATPARGEELGLGDPIVLTFSAPMDRSSVESAIQLVPADPLRYAWIDGRTLHVLPETAWSRDTAYTLTVTTAARAESGAALESGYSLRFRTVGFLEVTQTVPAGRSQGIGVESTVVITFNRPVVALTALSDPRSEQLPQPLSFRPEVEGTGEWLNTSIYVFTPSSPLRGGTTYTATVPAGLTDSTGGLLSSDATWTFTTERPKVTWTDPDSGASLVGVDARIRIAFNMPIDETSAVQRFALRKIGFFGVPTSPAVAGTFAVEGADLLFTPSEPLAFDEEYAVTLQPGVTGAGGGLGTEQLVSWRFRTVPLPRVVGTTPKDGDRDVSPYASFFLRFNAPIDPDTVMEHVSIDPAPAAADLYTYYRSWDRTFVVGFGAEPSREYTIHVSPGIEDPYGNETAQRLVVRFQTAALDPAAWFHFSGRVATCSSYEPTRLFVGHRNLNEVRITVTPIDVASYLDAVSDWYRFQPSASDGSRSWSVRVSTPLNEVGFTRIDLADGAPLDSGIYVVDVRSDSLDWDRWQHRRILIVSPVDLTMKTSDEETLVWATDLETGSPVSGLILWAMDGDGNPVDVDVTDSRGLARFPGSRDTDWRGLTVMGRNPFVLSQSDWGDGISAWDFGFNAETPPSTRVYVDTDRPIYRPGQTVFFRAVVRTEDDADYALPSAGEAGVTITDAVGQLLYEETLPLDDYGTLSGELALGPEAALGGYSLRIEIDGRTTYDSFQVAAYRAPEFGVTVTSDPTEAAHGDPLSATVHVGYFFGAPVADVPVDWTVVSTRYVFSPAPFARFTFSDNDDPWTCRGCWWQPTPPARSILDGSGRTDASGDLVLELPADLASRSSDPSETPITDSRTLLIEATAYGPDGGAISGRATAVVHQGSFYVGVAAAQALGRAGEEMPIDVVTVDWQGGRLASQSLSYTVYRREWTNTFEKNDAGGGRWTWSSEDVEVDRGSVATDGRAEGRLSFVPSTGGTYKVAVSGRDERERRIRAAVFVWVSGSDSVSWRRESDDRLTLISDKVRYAVGETAEILVPSPYPGPQWAWVTVERGGILSQEVVELPSNSSVIRVPISDDAIPNVYVGVVLVQGRAAAVAAGAPPTSGLKVGYVALSVDPAPRLLSIELTPSRPAPGPGETVDYGLRVADADGLPVRGSFSLDLVDEAILTLQPRTADRIVETFYGERGLGVRTSSGLTLLLGRLVLEQAADEDLANSVRKTADDLGTSVGSALPMAAPSAMVREAAPPGAGVSAAEQLPAGVTLREDFADTAFWKADVVTDADGRAAVTLELPDNLTTWVVRAVGATSETEVGEATGRLLVTKPVLIRPVVPRFFVAGDRVQLAASVTNQTEADLSADVTLASTGLVLEDPAVRTIDVPAAGETKVTWWVVVQDVSNVDVAFSVVAGDWSDAARPRLTAGPEGTVPVYRYTAPETVGTAGELSHVGARTETIALPPHFDPERSRVDVRLDFSLAAAMREGLGYLEHFEYECTEQVVSRFLPNVLTYRALRRLGLGQEDLAAKLDALVREGLEKLYKRQNADGGWGWWDGERSNPHLTAYAAYALLRLGEADLAVRQDVLDHALDSLQKTLVTAKELAAAWEANRQAWLLYVLALANRSDVVGPHANDLFAVRDKLSHYAKAYLAMAMQRTGAKRADIDTLLSDLANEAILSATGAHWEEAGYDFWAMNTDTRSTAVILDAYVQLDPKNALIPNVVRWLMIARRNGIWETTQETSWALISLTDWMVESGELEARYAYGLLWDGEPVLDGTVAPETVGDSVEQTIRGMKLGTGDIHRLTVDRGDGPGRLYYTAHLNVQLPADEVDPLDRGIVVYRQYVTPDCPRATGCDEVNEAAIGETVEVRLTIIAPHDLYYVVVEDPIPAGCEAVDVSLATTSVLEPEPGLRRESNGRTPWFGWWWWRWYSRSEMRDEKTVLFVDYLPAGTYSYRYTIRAVQPGDYQVLPSSAHEFYFPEVFGRSAGRLFTVVPSE